MENYKKILDYLYSLESPKIKLGLGRVQDLLDKAGNPEKKLRCMHVAGTNGKGSVCAMLSCILMEAGYKVGMYTSPHLKRFNERIRINEKQITDRDIVECFLKIQPHIKNQSFFEITTALAFLHFAENDVDFVVLEAGLGGRLDATNVVDPLVSVITNISLEHTKYLGNTVEEIAFEKAGIIKNYVPVVTGARGNALKAIRDIAKERNAPLLIAKKHAHIDFKYLNGSFQQINKDIALTAIDSLVQSNKIRIGKKEIIDGIKKTRWKGRLEFISKSVLVDAGHNPGGFEALKKELSILKKERRSKNLIFVVGIQSDKDSYEMLRIISPLVSAIIFTKSGNPKALGPRQLLERFNAVNKNKKITKKIAQNPKKALAYAKKIAHKNDLIIAAGSIYMIGELV